MRVWSNSKNLGMIFLTGLCALALAACDVEETASSDSGGSGDSGGSEEAEDTGVGEGDGSLGGSGGTVDTTDITAFTVRATSEDTDYTIYLSKDGDGETPCSPDDDDPIITCEINIEELDLFIHGLSFTVVAPQAQCDYIEYTPYFYSIAPVDFFNASPVAVMYALDGDGDFVAPSGGAVFPTLNIVEETDANAADIWYRLYNHNTDDSEWVSHNTLYGSTATETSDLRCPFDYSNVTNLLEGQNCCFSSYTAFIDNNGDESNETVDWGGSFASCFRGVANSSDYDGEVEETTGLKGSTFTYVPDSGFTQTYSFTSPIDLEVKENIHIANYHASTAFAGFPRALRDGFPYYQFSCLDHNRENLYRINIQVREWNTDGELEQYVAGDSDVSGNEDAPFAGADLDDVNDWDALGDTGCGSLATGFGFSSGAAIEPYLENVSAAQAPTMTWLRFVNLYVGGVACSGMKNNSFYDEP